MLRILKKNIRTFLASSGILTALAGLRHSSKHSLLILSYHKVYRDYDPLFPGVTLNLFKNQMRYLKTNYNLLPLEDALQYMSSGGAFDRPTACVTFDDGYQCVFEHAFPLFAELEIPVTIFVTTGFVGSRHTIWPDRLANLFRITQLVEFRHNGQHYSIGQLSGKVRVLEQMKQMFKRCSHIERESEISVLSSVLGGEQPTPYPFVTWEMILEMRKAGVQFGVHTVTHPILSIMSASEQEWEVTTSKRQIESVLDEEVCLFAYPNGMPQDYSQVTISALKQSGYKYALLNCGGIYRPESHIDYEIPRVSETRRNMSDFIVKISGVIPY